MYLLFEIPSKKSETLRLKYNGNGALDIIILESEHNLTPFLACSSLRSVRGRFFNRVSNFGFASAFPDLPFFICFTVGGEEDLGDAPFSEAFVLGSGVLLDFDDRDGIEVLLLHNTCEN